MRYEMIIPSADLEEIWVEKLGKKVPRDLRLSASRKVSELYQGKKIALSISDTLIGVCKVVNTNRTSELTTITLFPIKSSWRKCSERAKEILDSAMESVAAHNTSWSVVDEVQEQIIIN